MESNHIDRAVAQCSSFITRRIFHPQGSSFDYLDEPFELQSATCSSQKMEFLKDSKYNAEKMISSQLTYSDCVVFLIFLEKITKKEFESIIGTNTYDFFTSIKENLSYHNRIIYPSDIEKYIKEDCCVKSLFALINSISTTCIEKKKIENIKSMFKPQNKDEMEISHKEFQELLRRVSDESFSIEDPVIYVDTKEDITKILLTDGFFELTQKAIRLKTKCDKTIVTLEGGSHFEDEDILNDDISKLFEKIVTKSIYEIEYLKTDESIFDLIANIFPYLKQKYESLIGCIESKNILSEIRLWESYIVDNILFNVEINNANSDSIRSISSLIISGVSLQNTNFTGLQKCIGEGFRFSQTIDEPSVSNNLIRTSVVEYRDESSALLPSIDSEPSIPKLLKFYYDLIIAHEIDLIIRKSSLWDDLTRLLKETLIKVNEHFSKEFIKNINRRYEWSLYRTIKDVFLSEPILQLLITKDIQRYQSCSKEEQDLYLYYKVKKILPVISAAPYVAGLIVEANRDSIIEYKDFYKLATILLRCDYYSNIAELFLKSSKLKPHVEQLAAELKLKEKQKKLFDELEKITKHTNKV